MHDVSLEFVCRLLVLSIRKYTCVHVLYENNVFFCYFFSNSNVDIYFLRSVHGKSMLMYIFCPFFIWKFYVAPIFAPF